MKVLMILLITSSFAMATFNDFECDFTTSDGMNVSVEIESQRGAGMRRATIAVRNNGEVDYYNYYVNSRYNRAFNEIRYFGGGMDLEIDLWPDAQPRWGRSYRADLRTWDLGNNSSNYNILCRYTRI